MPHFMTLWFHWTMINAMRNGMDENMLLPQMTTYSEVRNSYLIRQRQKLGEKKVLKFLKPKMSLEGV